MRPGSCSDEASPPAVGVITLTLGTACAFKPKHLGQSQEEHYAVMAKQGRGLYGIDMKIVGEDGAELPWGGEKSGELLVRGPWVVNRYFKDEGGNPLLTDADGQATAG